MLISRCLVLVLSAYLLFCNTVAGAEPVLALQHQAARLLNQSGGTEREQKIRRILAMRLMKIHDGADVNHQDKRGQTVLMLAAAINHSEIVTSMLLRGADPTIQTNKGKCAHDFCTDSALVSLLQHSSLPAAEGVTLHQAVLLPEAEATSTALQLLRAGADVNEPDSSGRTPIMLISAEQRELAAILLTAGADPVHWGQAERAKAKVQFIDVVFTHRGLSAEELEAEDKAHARQLDELRQQKARWRRFTDPAMRSRRRLSMPHSFTWDWKQRCHISKDLLNKLKLENGSEEAGRSGYLGHVYLGTLTLHYPDGVPPLSFPVQCGGRAEHYLGAADATIPLVPEGATARLFPDYRGHTLNGFFISCLGREAVPRFSADREHIMLHMAPVAVPGKTEDTTIRTTGSHGCLSIKNPDHWKTICAELRKKGTATHEGLELRIRYDVK